MAAKPQLAKGVKCEGRFEVLEHIGDGGMGEVYRARDLRLGHEIAVKVCQRGGNKSRFAREVRLMQSVSHPNVMPVLFANVTFVWPYFAMPLALRSLENELPALAADRDAAVEAFRLVCAGTQAIHAAGATHRDIKPANVMRLPGGTLVVTDLGLGRFDERDSTTLTQANAFIGTRAYSAPEQLIDGRYCDHRTDIFQLGKTLYQLLTGESPALIDLTKIPPGLGVIVARATKDHPDARYQSIEALVGAIESYMMSTAPDANPALALAELIDSVEKALRFGGRHSDKDVERILQLFSHFPARQWELVNSFDRIPERLLPVMAKFPRFEAAFVTLLDAYCEALDEGVAERNFAYAEVVAAKMKMVFEATSSPGLKAGAVKALLLAAVGLHRFAAMEVLDAMLTSVRSGDDAIAIADVLQQNLTVYRAVATRVPPMNLHTAIRRVRDAAVATDASAA